MKHLLSVIFCLFCACAGTMVQAQNHTLSGNVTDSLTRQPLTGAVVTVVTGRDTLHTTSGAEGRFSVQVAPGKKHLLEVTFLGYKIFRRTIDKITGPLSLGVIRLCEDPLQIDQITVKGRIRMMTQRGDTLVYNPAAFRVMPGDETIELIKLMPGIELSAGGVSVFGKEIARTYIDGKLIFGKEAMNALNNLQADDVASVEVYEEENDDDRLLPKSQRRRQTVFNILTFSHLNASTVGHFLTGYGKNMEKGVDGKYQDRYAAGATVNYFSEKQQFTSNLFANNINRSSNKVKEILDIQRASPGYQRKNAAELAYYTDGEKGNLDIKYYFDNDLRETERQSEQTYFPTQEYTSRFAADSSSSDNRTTRHRLYLTSNLGLKKDNIFLTFFLFSDQNQTSTINRNQVGLNGEILNDINQHSDNNSENNSYLGMVTWHRQIKSGSLSTTGSFGYNTGQGDDKLTDRNTPDGPPYQQSDTRSKGRSASIKTKYSLPLSEKSSLSADYEIDYNHSDAFRWTLDGKGMIDTVQSYRYIQNNTTHTGGIGYRYDGIQGIRISANIRYVSAIQNRDEFFPAPTGRRPVFNSIQPSLQVFYSKASRSFSFFYMPRVSPPAMNMLVDKLDVRNPLSLLGGNPDLKQSYGHNFTLSYSWGNIEKARQYSLNAQFVYTNNMPVVKRTFFTEDTPLPRYGNTIAPKGATLTTYENASGNIQASIGMEYSGAVHALRSKLRISADLDYTRAPAYVDNTLVSTQTLMPNLNVMLRSNISSAFQFTVASQTGYTYAENSATNTDRYLTQRVNTSFTGNFLKRCYVNTSYEFYLLHNPRLSGNINHIWNLALGYKMLKKRNLDFSITAYDLLNRNKSFVTKMSENYITQTWSQIFSRYITFNIGFRFNKIKTETPPSTLSDGSFNSGQ